MFFIMMLAAFLALVSPASRRAKPGCMRKTSTAATKMKMLSRTTMFMASAPAAVVRSYCSVTVAKTGFNVARCASCAVMSANVRSPCFGSVSSQ